MRKRCWLTWKLAFCPTKHNRLLQLLEWLSRRPLGRWQLAPVLVDQVLDLRFGVNLLVMLDLVLNYLLLLKNHLLLQNHLRLQNHLQLEGHQLTMNHLLLKDMVALRQCTLLMMKMISL